MKKKKEKKSLNKKIILKKIYKLKISNLKFKIIIIKELLNYKFIIFHYFSIILIKVYPFFLSFNQLVIF